LALTYVLGPIPPGVGSSGQRTSCPTPRAQHIPVLLDPTPDGTGLGAFVGPILQKRAGEGEEKSKSKSGVPVLVVT